MKYEIITASTHDSILTLDEIKRHLRIKIGETKDDSELKIFRDSVEEQFEEYCRRKFRPQTAKFYFDDFPACDYFKIPIAPLRSIPTTGLVYTNSTGQSQVFSSTKWSADTIDSMKMGRLVLKFNDEWPTDTLSVNNPISIECNIGYAGSTSVPVTIKHAMLLMVASYNENREDFNSIIYTFKEIPRSAKVILKPYRIWEIK